MKAREATETLLGQLSGDRPVALEVREALAVTEAMTALAVFLAKLPTRRLLDYPYSPGTIRTIERKLLAAWPELAPIVRPSGPKELRRYRR